LIEGVELRGGSIASARTSAVEPSPIRKLVDAISVTPGVVGLHVGEPDFDTPAHIKQAAIRALNAGSTHYTNTAGIPELREAIAEKLGKENGVDVDPENEVLVTHGGYAAIYASLQALIDPSDEILLIEPAWTYDGFIALAGGRKAPCGLHGPSFELTRDALESKISDRTKLILVSSPNNPTGNMFSREELEIVAEVAKTRDLLVLSDEVYEKLVYDGLSHCSIASFPGMSDRTITVNSFSKTYAMTGWRIGYIAASKEVVTAIKKVVAYGYGCINAAVQKAAVEALTGPQDCVKEMLKEYDCRRHLIVKGLNEISGVECKKPKGAFYAFANILSFKLSSQEFAAMLLQKAKVATIPGSAFGSSGEGYLRISFATSQENIVEGLDRISKFVDEL
jgi:aspartate/methionine/tyrosine aminotransferase